MIHNMNSNTWAKVYPESNGAPRIVFFSIKGGIGRTTALAATAWNIARQGKTVLVFDMNLDAPGLDALMPQDRLPAFGVIDWLTEKCLDSTNMCTQINSSVPLYLVPAHGTAHDVLDKYIKATKIDSIDLSARLAKLFESLENKLCPDVILVDSPAGIGDVAATCVSSLNANSILLFADLSPTTWRGYKAIFEHWKQNDVVCDVRERLQIVAGLTPDDQGRYEYLSQVKEKACELFSEFYDEIAPGETSGWNFELNDKYAPHYPLVIRWSRGWVGIENIRTRLGLEENYRHSSFSKPGEIAADVRAIFGPLTDHVECLLEKPSVCFDKKIFVDDPEADCELQL